MIIQRAFCSVAATAYGKRKSFAPPYLSDRHRSSTLWLHLIYVEGGGGSTVIFIV